jgi:hypothetical protein
VDVCVPPGGINGIIDNPQIMINAFPSKHSTWLETSNSYLYVAIPFLYIALNHWHYSVAFLQYFQPPMYESPCRNFTQTSTIQSMSTVLNSPLCLHDRQDSLQPLVNAEVQPLRNSLLSDLRHRLCTDPFDWTHGWRTIHPGLNIDIIVFGSRFMTFTVKNLLIHLKINLNHCGLSNIWYNYRQHPLLTIYKVLLHLPKCPKASIAALQVICTFFCHTTRLSQS